MATQFLNSSDSAVIDGLEGLVAAHPGLLLLKDKRVVLDGGLFTKQGASKRPKVSLVSGGGSGHEPFCAGFVGKGMLSGVACGPVFTSPASHCIAAAIAAVNPQTDDPESGVLVIVFNYTGDRLTFGLAVERCKAAGINVEMHISGDDSALTSIKGTAGRRGLCGTLFTIKIAGAMAEGGSSLQSILTTCERLSLACGTVGVSVSGCTLPGHRDALFKVEPGMLELGLGVHGEAGAQTIKNKSTKDIAALLVNHLTKPNSETRLNLAPGDSVALMINNLGSTPLIEVTGIAKEVYNYLGSMRVKVCRVIIGSLMTSLDMRGFQISVLRLDDPHWLTLLDAPTDAPAWPRNYITSSFDVSVPDLKETSKTSIKLSQLSKESANIFRSCLQALVDELPKYEDDLNTLDTGCGDGDCGTTLRLGSEGIRHLLPSMDCSNPSAVMLSLADIASTNMGGTSGGVYSIILAAASAVLAKAEDLKEYKVWVGAFKSSLEAVAKYGGASLGDRTLLDAAYPALDAMQKLTHNNSPFLQQVLATMAEAAKDGAGKTISMKARAGRASYVRGGDVNTEDAGARGFYYILKVIAEAVS